MGSGFSTRSVMVPDSVAGFGLQHEVRHAIAPRGEARPRVSAADEQGRSSLPRGKETEGSGSGAGSVGRDRIIDQRLSSDSLMLPSTQPSVLDPALDSALGEARPRVSAADEQGRSSLTRGKETEGSGTGSVGRERMNRVDGLIRWPVGQRRDQVTTERARQTGLRLAVPSTRLTRLRTL